MERGAQTPSSRLQRRTTTTPARSATRVDELSNSVAEEGGVTKVKPRRKSSMHRGQRRKSKGRKRRSTSAPGDPGASGPTPGTNASAPRRDSKLTKKRGMLLYEIIHTEQVFCLSMGLFLRAYFEVFKEVSM
jgi:hypothetical protein